MKPSRRWGRVIRGSAGLLAAGLGLVGAAGLQAQDRRRIQRPSLPPACARLTARKRLLIIPAPPGSPAGTFAETVAAKNETRLDTARIQAALDACPAGQGVYLQAAGAERAFVAGPLQLRRTAALVIGQRVVLLASRDPRQFDRRPGSCGVVNRDGRGCRALITGERVDGAAVMGAGTIDGRGWAPLLQPGPAASWWELAQQAKARRLNQNCPRLLVLNHCNRFTLYRITLRNSPNFHVLFNGGDGLTAWGVRIDSPQRARNTDGIDPLSASDVTITRCWIHAGDDDVAIKAGNGGPAEHISVTDNHFYTGHGISIGSETNGGVRAIRVANLTIDGADNGIRIKSNVSRGGVVREVQYRNICIRNTRNPLLFDMHYPFYGPRRDLPPSFRGIRLDGIRITGGGKLIFRGLGTRHRVQIELRNLQAHGRMHIAAEHARIAAIATRLPPIHGPDVVERIARLAPRHRRAAAPACHFPPFPAARPR